MSPPLRLHGYPVSNYFNIARAALIEKALPHDIVVVRAAQDEAFLAMNPMGKIPVLETPDGWIGETVAILEYLDDAFPERPLRPEGAFDRARDRQIVNIVQMYVEAPARSLFPGVFAHGEVPAAAEAAAGTMLTRAAGALSRLMAPAPLLLGDRPGAADLFAFYNLAIAERVTRHRFGWSLLDRIGGLDAWLTAMTDRASTVAVLTDFDTYFQAYLAAHDAPYREPTSGSLADA